MDDELFRINREMLKMVMEKYPLRGFVAKVDGEEVLLNLGAKQGVVKGTRFDVLEEGGDRLQGEETRRRAQGRGPDGGPLRRARILPREGDTEGPPAETGRQGPGKGELNALRHPRHQPQTGVHC